MAILGPGLLGGSVALAARERRMAAEISLWARRAEAVEALREAGAADVVSDQLSEVVAGADLIVLATPVGALGALLDAALPALTAGAVITDLCSVKATAVDAVEAALARAGRDDVAFVGAHPMAGSEQTGFEHARPDLFVGAACAITPGVASTPAAVASVTAFWSGLGCRTIELSADDHDHLVARVSHLPHIAASALVLAALRDGDRAEQLAGPGLRDTTRVASGAPDMWTEILAENREAVAAALEGYIDQLGEVLAKLRDMDNEGMRRLLADAKDRRAALPARPSDRP